MTFPTPLNNLSDFNSKMLTFGALHADDLDIPPVTNQDYNFGLNNTYYDGAWVYFQIADYTGDQATWKPVAIKFNNWYRDNYVFSDVHIGDYSGGGSGVGAVSGFHIFPIGLFEDFTRNGTALSKNAALAMSVNASFSADTTPLSYTLAPNPDQNGGNGGSREVAYQILAHLYARKLGQTARARLNDMVNQALSHIQQWFVLQTSSYIRCFMVALTCHSLIVYCDNTVALGLPDRTAEIYAAIKIAKTYLRDHLWIEHDLAFAYTDRITDGGPSDIAAAPDLNLLIILGYAWLYHQDGDASWITFADKAFKGGVVGAGSSANPSGAFLSGFAKQFHQNYRTAIRYTQLRDADPLTIKPDPGGSVGVEVSTSNITRPLIFPISRETIQAHFIDRGWTTPQMQVDAGFPILGEPTPGQANFSIVRDVGALIETDCTIEWQYNLVTIDHPVDFVVTMSISVDSVTYTDFAAGQNPIFARGFRYVKLSFEATGSSGRSMASIDAQRLRLTLKTFRDGGVATLGATDMHISPLTGLPVAGTWVTFNKQFADVKSIVPGEYYQSGLGSKVKAYAIPYDVPNPTGFALIMFRTDTGAQIGGDVAWAAQGN